MAHRADLICKAALLAAIACTPVALACCMDGRAGGDGDSGVALYCTFTYIARSQHGRKERPRLHSRTVQQGNNNPSCQASAATRITALRPLHVPRVRLKPPSRVEPLKEAPGPLKLPSKAGADAHAHKCPRDSSDSYSQHAILQ